MIPDRIIEEGTLKSNGQQVSVQVRIPWYRALPASCIGQGSLSIDGQEVPPTSLRWQMNGKEFTFPELAGKSDEWWFPQDSAVLSGELDIAPGEEHSVEVGVVLFIPYIVMDGDEVLHIEEHDEKRMTAEELVAS